MTPVKRSIVHTNRGEGYFLFEMKKSEKRDVGEMVHLFKGHTTTSEAGGFYFYTMSQSRVQSGGRSLVTCFDAYSKSLKTCYASLEPGNPTLECIKDHVVALIGEYVCGRLEDQSPFCILSVGSGDGKNDLAFLEILRKLGRGKDNKVRIFERAIEPDEKKLGVFCAKAEHLRESLKSKVSIEFDWRATTHQEYAVQKTEDDVKFDLVHFFHSLYYTDLEALEHLRERTWDKRSDFVHNSTRGECCREIWQSIFSSRYDFKSWSVLQQQASERCR